MPFTRRWVGKVCHERLRSTCRLGFGRGSQNRQVANGYVIAGVVGDKGHWTAAAAIQASANEMGQPVSSQSILIRAHRAAVSVSGSRGVKRGQKAYIRSRRLTPQFFGSMHTQFQLGCQGDGQRSAGEN